MPNDYFECSASNTLLSGDHPIVNAFNRIDRNVVDRMMGRGKPGGALEAYGVRNRNGKLEVFERAGLGHVMWCCHGGQAQSVADTLNRLVVAIETAR